MLKSLTVVIALTFATAASAQGQCQNVSEIHRNLDRIINQVELVPSDEAKYIKAEKAKALEHRNENRFMAIYNRRFYAAAQFHDDAAVVMQNVEAAERATVAKDVATYLIVVLSRLSDLASSMNDFIEADGKRQQPTLSRKDRESIAFDIAIVKGKRPIFCNAS